MRDRVIHTRRMGRAPDQLRTYIGGYLTQEGFAFAGVIGTGPISAFDIDRIVGADYDPKRTMLTWKTRTISRSFC